MSPRLAAANALATVMAGKASLGSSLPAQLKQVAPRDHALTRELALGTARWFQRLDGRAGHLMQKPLKAADRDLHALLLIGMYQLLYTRVPAHAAIGETVQLAVTMKKVWAAELEAGSGQPGEILDCSKSGLLVACGEGALRLTRLQLPGGKPLAFADLYNARRDQFAPGQLLADGQ